MSGAPQNCEEKILWALQAAWPNWVPAPELVKICLQYSRAIHSLRHKRGFLIANRVEIVNGVKVLLFLLGPRPVVPDSRALKQKQNSESLFGDLSPMRYPD